jgi:hypothetical protein
VRGFVDRSEVTLAQGCLQLCSEAVNSTDVQM